MRQKLYILFALLSLILFCNSCKEDSSVVRNDVVKGVVFADVEQCFVPADSDLNLNGRRGSSASLTVSYSKTVSATPRRSALTSLMGVKLAVASLHSERSYSYSCNFPFDHQPQRELFFILRNIRI